MQKRLTRTPIRIESPRLRRGLTALAVTGALAAPTAAQAADEGGAERSKHAERYLEVRHDYVKAFGVEAAGRNIVRDGFHEADGDVRRPQPGEVKDSTVRMSAELGATAEPEAAAPAAEAEGGYETAGAPTSVVECESGGDYAAVNPAGYYGAYQFDQGTWDAYAPSGYAGTNPAAAPAEVQDATAAAVPYDAWPNC